MFCFFLDSLLEVGVAQVIISPVNDNIVMSPSTSVLVAERCEVKLAIRLNITVCILAFRWR